MSLRVVILLKGYPRLSETFIAQEILGLEQRGLELMIAALRRPTDVAIHDLHERIRAPVLYLPEYAKDDPARIARALWRCLWLPGFARSLLTWLVDLVRDPTANRARRYAQALVLAAELPAEIEHLHVHFLHTPGSVGRYAALLRRLPFSLSAHAKDIWTTPPWEKRAKLEAATWTVTCTQANLDHLRSLAPSAEIELVRHGIDLARFGRAPEREVGAPVILAVARAVEKKGLDTLLEALAALPPDLPWSFEHIGGGPLIDDLRSKAARLGIDQRLTWLGPQPHSAVLSGYRRADLFCLPSQIAADGDRDGLPNVLMEAMSQEVAVISTTVSAIPEIVQDGANGLLVPPDDPQALRAAIERLLRDASLRRRLARAGRIGVECSFQAERGLDRVASRLRHRRRTCLRSHAHRFLRPAEIAKLCGPVGRQANGASTRRLGAPPWPRDRGREQLSQLRSRWRSGTAASSTGTGRALRQPSRETAARRTATCRLADLSLLPQGAGLVGPAVTRELGWPYLVIEPSLAAKREHGPWAIGHAGARAAIAAADMVLALTPEDADGLVGVVREPAEIQLFPPFVEAAPFRAAAARREDHRNQLARDLGLDGATPWLLTVAMMRSDVKRLSYFALADALERLLDRPWTLIVVGDGDARSEIEARFAAMGRDRVRWIGMLAEPDLPPIYASADLFVWPAFREAYGIVLLEAQAAGLPVVACREGGVAEIVTSGSTGLLVAGRSPDDFAGAVATLLADPDLRQRLGSAASSRVAERHDVPAAAARLARALDAALRIRADRA